jgi:hypothetical protein
MNYEQEYKEFSKWWEELTAENPNWATLERLAAKDAWMEATKRAEVNGAETSHDKALHKHNVNARFPEKEDLESECTEYMNSIIKETDYRDRPIYLKHAFKAGVNYLNELLNGR